MGYKIHVVHILGVDYKCSMVHISHLGYSKCLVHIVGVVSKKTEACFIHYF